MTTEQGYEEFETPDAEEIKRRSRAHVQAMESSDDPEAWVYDIGENGDCSVDALICDNTADLITAFRGLPTAKASSLRWWRRPMSLTPARGPSAASTRSRPPPVSSLGTGGRRSPQFSQ